MLAFHGLSGMCAVVALGGLAAGVGLAAIVQRLVAAQQRSQAQAAMQ